ncbi:MAG: L-histidine N(alpha)-methyltransferase [Acidobacteriota bacterium]
MTAFAAAEAQDRQEEAADSAREEILAGLRSVPKTIHCKFLYDERGSQLFDAITELPEYYPTRTELAIMEEHVEEMARSLGPHVLLVELGSGSSTKTPMLLERLDEPVAYVPVDISSEHLHAAAERLRERFPRLDIQPIAADYTADYRLPEVEARRTVVYFPGSTIGNFPPGAIEDFLRHIAELCGPGGALLIGVDLRKDRETLERAYDDAEGVTAAFNLNLLRRFNRELGADFDLDAFAHRAIWNEVDGRIEMSLVSRRDQTVSVGEEQLQFAAGEAILTEHSHKFTVEQFAEIAAAAGFRVDRVWADSDNRFSVQFLTVA